MIHKLLNIGGRDEQQDTCDFFQNTYTTLLVLADGMGGHSGGKIASKMLVSVAEYLFKKENALIENPKEFFQNIVDTTTFKLKEYTQENSNNDPHTTCVLAIIQNNHLFVGHIGDSRMYLFIDKKFRQRSKDHSVVQMLLNDGEITEEEMSTHPDQNKLLKSISTRKDAKITFKEYSFPLDKSNSILICSDGFWEQITTQEMQSQLFNNPIKDSLLTMVNNAKEKGGKDGDNISVVAYIYKGSKPTLLPSNKAISKFKNIFISTFALILIFVGVIYYSQFDKSVQLPPIGIKKIEKDPLKLITQIKQKEEKTNKASNSPAIVKESILTKKGKIQMRDIANGSRILANILIPTKETIVLDRIKNWKKISIKGWMVKKNTIHRYLSEIKNNTSTVIWNGNGNKNDNFMNLRNNSDIRTSNIIAKIYENTSIHVIKEKREKSSHWVYIKLTGWIKTNETVK